jgi:hypothetical protein
MADKSIDVFLDSSVLPRSPAHLGLGFESLCQLAQSGLVKVYLSTVVEREWRSQLEDAWIDLAARARTAVQDLLDHPWSPSLEQDSSLGKALAALSIPGYRIRQLSRSNAEGLIARLDPEILPIGPDHAPNVFDQYFDGSSPFSSRKQRKDIPDAFIHQAARGLAERLDGELQCVIGDSALRNSLARHRGVVTHETIGKFVRVDYVRALTKQLGPAQLWAATLSTLNKKLPEAASVLTEQLNEALSEALLWQSIKHQDIPDDNQEGIISLVYETSHVYYGWDATLDFGPGLIALPFETVVPVTISFMVFRGDAFGVPDGVAIDFTELASDHYYEAEADIDVEVLGLASIRFDLQDLGGDDLPRLKQVGVHEFERIRPEEQSSGTIFRVVHHDTESSSPASEGGAG